MVADSAARPTLYSTSACDKASTGCVRRIEQERTTPQTWIEKVFKVILVIEKVVAELQHHLDTLREKLFCHQLQRVRKREYACERKSAFALTGGVRSYSLKVLFRQRSSAASYTSSSFGFCLHLVSFYCQLRKETYCWKEAKKVMNNSVADLATIRSSSARHAQQEASSNKNANP
jgi:hypothetical protein